MDSERETTIWDLWKTKLAAEQVQLPNGNKAQEIDHVGRDWFDKYSDCCFGFINDTLYLGTVHHAKIIYELIESGAHDWESMMNAKQKWGWIRKIDVHMVNYYKGQSASNKPFWGTVADGDLIVQFTTDEASQTIEEGFAESVVQSISQYFNNRPAHINPDVGEGWTNADSYGERSKQQYWGEESNEAYCEDCDEYYDPNYESHDHEQYCSDCKEYYNNTDEYDVDLHNKAFCPACQEHYDEWDDEEALHHDHSFVPEPWMPQAGALVYWKNRYYKIREIGTAGAILDQLSDPQAPQNQAQPYEPMTSLVPWSMFKDQEVKKVNPNQMALPTEYDPSATFTNTTLDPNDPMDPRKDKLASIQDLHDDRVFAKLSLDYLRKYSVPLTDDEWEKSMQGIHEMGQDYAETGGDVAQPIEDSHTKLNPVPPTGEADITPNNTSNLQPDDPKLLSIERNKDSKEFRWSYDGTQLHIWAVLNRWQYGPSHYDMFGFNGYDQHSQGRVYISPDGEIGVLYWQISHPECEDVLNQWVMDKYGRMPDYVYRAYGPYKGYVTPRFDFPIVEVSGLPLRSHERWWEVPGRKSDSWYKANDVSNPYSYKFVKKNYPAPKQKTTVVPGDVDYSTNSKKEVRRKRRQKNKKNQYRNRRFR